MVFRSKWKRLKIRKYFQIAVYNFVIQLDELWQKGPNTTAQNLKEQQETHTLVLCTVTFIQTLVEWSATASTWTEAILCLGLESYLLTTEKQHEHNVCDFNADILVLFVNC